MTRSVTCELCLLPFYCGDGPGCWCDNVLLPDTPLDYRDCICRPCLVVVQLSPEQGSLLGDGEPGARADAQAPVVGNKRKAPLI